VIAFYGGLGRNSSFIEDLVRDRPDIHRLSCEDIASSIAELDRLLADPAWQEQVARAAPRG
jgi:hypothetical protein